MMKKKKNNANKPPTTTTASHHNDDNGTVTATGGDGDLSFGWELFYDEGNNTKFGVPLSDEHHSKRHQPGSSGGSGGGGVFEYRSVGEFHTIPHFWQYWNHLEKLFLGIDPEKYFNMRIFRKGVRPLWEDPQNVNGGKFVLRMHKQDREFLWKELTMALVGHLAADHFTGIVLQSKLQNVDVVQLWIGRRLDDQGIEKRRKMLLQLCESPHQRNVTVTYISHDHTKSLNATMMAKSKQRVHHLKTESMQQLKMPAAKTPLEKSKQVSGGTGNSKLPRSRAADRHATESEKDTSLTRPYVLIRNESVPQKQFTSYLSCASQSLPVSPIADKKQKNDSGSASRFSADEKDTPTDDAAESKLANGNSATENTNRSKRLALLDGPSRRRASSSADEVMLTMVANNKNRVDSHITNDGSSQHNSNGVHNQSEINNNKREGIRKKSDKEPKSKITVDRTPVSNVSNSNSNSNSNTGGGRGKKKDDKRIAGKGRKTTSNRRQKEAARHEAKLAEIKRRNALFIRLSIVVAVLVMVIAFIVIHRQQSVRR